MLKDIQRNVRHIACASALYDWRLRGHTPDRLLVKPADPWTGDSESGRAFMAGGPWLESMHGFSWLRDLRAAGGAEARAAGRDVIQSWIRRYGRWEKTAWRGDLTGERISLWIAHYEFFASGAEENFQDEFFDSLIRQARHLRRALPGDLYGIGLLKAIKGLLYAGVAFEGYEIWIEHALGLLDKEIEAQILSDGSHVSRSPVQLMEALRHLLDIKSALAAAAYPLPETIQHAIDRAGPALRFFRYGDRHFGLWNGAQEGDPAQIDAVLAQAGTGGKALSALPAAGFERVSQGRTLLMFDCGRAPPWPYDEAAHAAPLSFELSCGRERIFVACGSHPEPGDWRDALRATAAHNTLTLDNRNACEIGVGGHFTRKSRFIGAAREETKNACLLEASHDGYYPVNGVTHRRRLYLTDQGHDLRGEDLLTSTFAPSKPIQAVIRFHIHPRVLVSLIQDGDEALLRLPTGIGWRFHQSGGARMVLEDSAYMGQGTQARKTKQLAIYAEFAHETLKVKWALRREGI